MALDRLEIGGMFAPHFKPNLSPPDFVRMYGCLANRLTQESETKSGETSSGKWGNLILHVISMLLTKVIKCCYMYLTTDVALQFDDMNVPW